jgi:hypothetical protein
LYFDVDKTVCVPSTFQCGYLALEAEQRGCQILHRGGNAFVCLCPWYRVYGVAYFCVKQMPIGVTAIAIELCNMNEGTRHFRMRIALGSLRAFLCCVGAVCVWTATNGMFRGETLYVLGGTLAVGATLAFYVVTKRQVVKEIVKVGCPEDG